MDSLKGTHTGVGADLLAVAGTYRVAVNGALLYIPALDDAGQEAGHKGMRSRWYQ